MKNTYYFPHDYHARHDPKLERLRFTLGCEGLGIYWCLAEMMYEQGGELVIDDIPSISKSLNADEDVVTKVINDFGLFQKNDIMFYSVSVNKRLQHINHKRIKAVESINRRWNTNVLPTNNETNTSKVKESKVNKRRDIVTPQDFLLSLKTKPEYKHIPIDNELLKMDTWLAAHPGRKKTPSFILRWLNKIESPIGSSGGTQWKKP